MTYLTPMEAAGTLRRHVKTIYRWIGEGLMFRHGEVVKVRHSYLIRAEAVERILREGTLG